MTQDPIARVEILVCGNLQKSRVERIVATRLAARHTCRWQRLMRWLRVQ